MNNKKTYVRVRVALLPKHYSSIMRRMMEFCRLLPTYIYLETRTIKRSNFLPLFSSNPSLNFLFIPDLLPPSPPPPPLRRAVQLDTHKAAQRPVKRDIRGPHGGLRGGRGMEGQWSGKDRLEWNGGGMGRGGEGGLVDS